jgi:hypothetical protein
MEKMLRYCIGHSRGHRLCLTFLAIIFFMLNSHLVLAISYVGGTNTHCLSKLAFPHAFCRYYADIVSKRLEHGHVSSE